VVKVYKCVPVWWLSMRGARQGIIKLDTATADFYGMAPTYKEHDRRILSTAGSRVMPHAAAVRWRYE